MATGSSEIYFPSSEHEKNYFDYLWDVANNRTPSAPGTTTLTGELSGLAAVTFFQRSGVDKGFLKQIWSLSTPVATMNAHQFYVALRFIAMIQNGEMPISRERLLATVKDKFELPRFNGIDVPVARPVAPVPTPQPVPTAIPPNAAAAAAAFAITPQEHVKYHSLFVGYDKDKDGFLSREEAVPVFRQSGLDERAVDQIWLFADDDRDNRLTSKEFSAAFHIIVCVSKRGQPFPTALPPSLKMFLLNAPAIPGEVPATLPPAPVAVAAPAPLPVPAPAPAPAPAPVEVKKLDISSAFSGFDDAPLPAPSATPAPATSSFASVSGGDDAELRNSLDAMKAATKKTVAAHEQAVEIGGKAYSSLQGIKQRLATDRIALEATVANAIAANNESNTKLELISQEIFQLQEQIRQLTQRLQEAQQSTSSTQSRVAKAQEEKQQLLRDIDQLLKQLDHSQSDSLALTDKLSAAERDAGRLEAENKALNLSATSLRNNSAVLAQENDELRRIASSLRERVGSASSAKQNLSTRLTLATDKVTSLQTTNQQLHVTVQQETKKQEVLKEERRALLNDVTPSSSSSGPAVAVSPRFEEDSLAFVSTKTLASSTTSNTFDDADDPFGGFDTDNKSVGTGFVKLEEETVVSTKSTVSPVPVVPVAPATSPAPARSPVPAPAPVVASTVSTAFDTSDPFGGFGDVSNAPLTSSTTAEDPFESAFSGSDVADPFGGDAGFDSVKSAGKLSAVVSPVGAADPFGGFDSLPSASPSKKEVTTPVSVQVADDPFAGFDDNVPLPKTSSLSPVPSKSQKDPFADFDEPAPAPATSAFPASPSKADSADPFGSVSVSAGFGDDKEDPFASFNDASDKATSDPFGGFDAPTTNKAVDDAFGSSAFGDANDDPFGTTSVNQKKATDDDDPFAGFD